MVMGACVVTEEHHVVFHVSGTCASAFAPKEERGREGEREGVREGRGRGREGDAEVSYIPLWGVGCFAYW